MSLTRREFLKNLSLAAGVLLLPPPLPEEAPRQIQRLGRAIKGVNVYALPSFKSTLINFVPTDTVINVYGSADDLDDAPNKVWYRVRSGYVHSAPIQTVRWDLQPPLQSMPPGGFLAEVTVPYASASLTGQSRESYRFYYGTTYWVRQIQVDVDQKVWYGVFDELSKSTYWVNAAHLRRVTAEELTPLSPEVADKHIAISLLQQKIRCYEGDQLALESPCSTGIHLRNENGRAIYGTPVGHWQVIRKNPTRHMAGDNLASADFFDLPGVPWVTFFHWWGVAIHGTYWHNDFGRPHSHGCINVPNEVAKWIYRWTTPTIGLNQQGVEAKGTPVIVDY